MEYEFYDKVIQRIKSIEKLLIKLNYKELFYYLNKAYKYILSNVDFKTYSFIHGDPNGSNVLVNPSTLDIKFVDPRGYFGFTKIYGLKEYDYAKVNYFLNGYDDFNQGNYLYSEKYYDKPKLLYKHKKLDTKLYNVMVGIIYLCLTSYISNDIFKVNIAYEHGVEILRRELDENTISVTN
jgi:hypothetical protein